LRKGIANDFMGSLQYVFATRIAGVSACLGIVAETILSATIESEELSSKPGIFHLALANANGSR
jgi:hypothetical protein